MARCPGLFASAPTDLGRSSPFLSCRVCSLPAKFKCGDCQITRYCCRQHQTDDWPAHRTAEGICGWARRERPPGPGPGPGPHSLSEEAKMDLSVRFWKSARQPVDLYCLSLYYAQTAHEDKLASDKFLHQAAEAGHSMALFDLGVRELIRLRYGPSLALFRRAASQGLADAQYYIGLLYEAGVPGALVARDTGLAHQHVSAAAEGGSASAMCALGRYHELGLEGIVARDPKRAAELYRRALDMGSPDAGRNLALCYALGVGVDRDPDEALRLMRAAAARAAIFADSLLGAFHELGVGTPPDIRRAIVHYVHNAEANDSPLAQYNLGRCFLLGLGVPQDTARATAWLMQAERGGLVRAGSLLRTIGRLPRSRWPAEIALVLC